MNEYILGLAVNVAPFIALFFWCFTIGFALIYDFHLLISVKVYLCTTALLLHVPLVELLLWPTAWRNSAYIFMAWSAMPYLLLLDTFVLVWLLIAQRNAKQVIWVRCVFCVSAFVALATFAAFVAGIRYLAVV